MEINNIGIRMRAYWRLLQIPYAAHAMNSQVRSRIEGWIGEIDYLLKIVRSRKLKLFEHVNKRF